MSRRTSCNPVHASVLSQSTPLMIGVQKSPPTCCSHLTVMSSLQLKRKSMLLPTQLKTELKRVCVCIWCIFVCVCVSVCRGCRSTRFSLVEVEARFFSKRWKTRLFHQTPPHLVFYLWPVAGGCSSFKKFSSSLMSHALLAYEFPWLQFRPIGWLYQADISARNEPSDKTILKTNSINQH